MTVRVYPVFEHFVPAVKLEDGQIVPVVVANRRKWEDRAELEAALVNRGYGALADSSGLWEYVGQKPGAKGRPPTGTLEEQATRRSEK